MRVDAKLASLGAVLLLSELACVPQAYATPITYTLAILPATFGSTTYWPSGKLGAVSFGDNSNHAFVVLTFQGDTTGVVPFSEPEPHDPGRTAAGFMNLIGTASVTVKEYLGTETVLAQGTFLASAGIFVSIDNVNGGIGFGSLGAAPSSSKFPGQPVYPYGVYPLTGAMAAYDLKSNFDLGFPLPAISCVGFDLTLKCGAPIALPTTAGDLVIDSSLIVSQMLGLFAAETQAVVPFSVLKSRVQIDDKAFEVSGSFTLGAGSNGINPPAEAVSLQLDTFSVSIPPGSFKNGREGRFVFDGIVAGVRLKFSIAPTTANSYSFRAEGRGGTIDQDGDPMSVGLTVGDDTGTSTAKVQSD